MRKSHVKNRKTPINTSASSSSTSVVAGATKTLSSTHINNRENAINTSALSSSTSKVAEVTDTISLSNKSSTRKLGKVDSPLMDESPAAGTRSQRRKMSQEEDGVG